MQHKGAGPLMEFGLAATSNTAQLQQLPMSPSQPGLRS